MSSNFKRLLVKDFPKPELPKESIEQNYWNQFEFPTVVKEFSAINFVDISPVQPFNALVTSSAKVQIFDKNTNEVKRTSTRSKDNIYGARYRNDGKLMVTGGESGLIQVLDTKSRAILRNLRGHTAATRVCTFTSEHTKIFSASDDKTVRQWDVPTEKELKNFNGATDYIRCGCNYPKNTDMFLTGSYDHTVKLWDFRSPSDNQVLSLDHGAPVESLIVHSLGGVCISAGNNYVKVWDLVAGRLINQFSNHQKSVTTLCFNGDETRLMSGSLDRNVKIYNVEDYSVVATLSYPSPILSMGLSHDDSYLVIGMADGAISLQKRKKIVQRLTAVATSATASNQYKRADNSEYKVKKIYKTIPQDHNILRKMKRARPKVNDVVVEHLAFCRVKMTKVDHLLRGFQYADALSTGMMRGEDEVIMSLLIELDRRDGLVIALKDQNSAFLLKFVKFLTRNISNHNYASTLIPIADLFIDLYARSMAYERKFLNEMQILNKALREELRVQEEGMKLLGALEQIFTIMTPPPKGTLENVMPTTRPVQNEKGITEIEQWTGVKTCDEVMSSRSSVDIDFCIDAHKRTNIVID